MREGVWYACGRGDRDREKFLHDQRGVQPWAGGGGGVPQNQGVREIIVGAVLQQSLGVCGSDAVR